MSAASVLDLLTKTRLSRNFFVGGSRMGGCDLQIMWNLSREAVKMQLLAFRCHGITLITLPPADERDWDIQFLQRSRTLEQWSDGVWGRGR